MGWTEISSVVFTLRSQNSTPMVHQVVRRGQEKQNSTVVLDQGTEWPGAAEWYTGGSPGNGDA